MALCKPIVLGPLSELSRKIRVQGQLAGSTVTVFSLPTFRKIAEGIAPSGDHYFDIFSYEQLFDADLLIAMQQFDGEVSEISSGDIGDIGMGVQPGPKNPGDIGMVGFRTHLYECGQFIWVEGAIPGAMVEVIVGNLTIGSGQALEGFVRIPLAPALRKEKPVQTHQFATLPSSVTATGPDVIRLPDPLPVETGMEVPSPIINAPLRGCDKAIFVTGIIDGAWVTLRRPSGLPDEFWGVDVNETWLELTNELVEGEFLSIKQDFKDENCKRFGKWSDPPSTVGPPDTVYPPIVLEPLCIGTQRISLRDLRPGATVSIFANGEVYKATAPLDNTEGTFGIPRLRSKTVMASQEVCGISSATSKPVAVEQADENIDAATVVGPLFACARTVSVKDIHRGAVVQVFAKNANGDGPISSQMTIYNNTHYVFPVTPFLQKDDFVYVRQWACASPVTDSYPEQVQDHPPVGHPHVVDSVVSGDMEIQLWDAIPGALVELYISRNGQLRFAGWEYGNALFRSLWLNCLFPLEMDDLLSIRQSLCNHVSTFSTDPSSTDPPVWVKGAHGYGPRPFYIIAHDANSKEEVEDALKAGANAIGPDVNVKRSNNSLCIDHPPFWDDEVYGNDDALSLEEYLDVLHDLAIKHPALSLVVFDCKPQTSRHNLGLTLLTEIRNRLTYDTGLNVIISIGTFGDAPIFENIKHLLSPREGLMIDEENDPIAVSNYFARSGVANQTYGNGITLLNFALGPKIRYSMERSCAFRAATGQIKFIEVWTVNFKYIMHEFVHIGVDGIITKDPQGLAEVINGYKSTTRLASRLDNPMRPTNFAFSLAVHTADKWLAGTNANIKFTLTGINGSSSITVNSRIGNRMERDRWDFITLPSPDLGELISISVQRDSQGLGEDWHLDKIVVESHRFGVSKTATFNKDIDNTSIFTEYLV